MSELACQEKNILIQKTKQQALDCQFNLLKAQLSIHINQSRECLYELVEKIEKILDQLIAVEGKIQDFDIIIKQKKRSVYEHEQKNLERIVLCFTNYATDLKILDEKNWEAVKGCCNYLDENKSVDDMEGNQDEVDNKNNKDDDGENEGLQQIGDKKGSYLKECEDGFQICHKKVCIENVFTLPFLFGHRERKTQQFFDRI